ncbi:hypothetical protein [Domibacillus indicus]|uniref:hypothetical protein n=1 Tax=Domibacillus indicus TaxID=1437523 RepID=UPI000617A9DE|nr:hypothetical protein [Domibacillus indicus]
MKNALGKKQFVQERFYFYYEYQTTETLVSRLNVLYQPHIKYLAEAAAQLGTYEFFMEHILVVFKEIKRQASLEGNDKRSRNSQKSRSIDGDYDDVYEGIKYTDPHLVAVELAHYIELLDHSSSFKIGRLKKKVFLSEFKDYLYKADALLGILEDS